ncbi:MAG: TniB family NTP-binding protein [Gammaproteobacteria bacterium]
MTDEDIAPETPRVSVSEARLLAPVDRIAYARADRWIAYPRANRIFKKLDALLNHPPTHRTPCLAVIGRSNNGKTMLLREFERRRAPRSRPLRESARVPVLYLQAPSHADRRELYDGLLRSLKVPCRYSESAGRKLSILLHVMSEVQVKMVVIDEFHQATALQRRQATMFMDSIKHLSNELAIPIVIAGTEAAALILKSEAQFSSRFEVEHLPVWKMDSEFARLLLTLGEQLPLIEKAELATPQIAPLLHSMSEGYIGDLWALLRRATIAAIEDGSEKITPTLLRKLDWTSPSQRKSALNKIL